MKKRNKLNALTETALAAAALAVLAPLSLPLGTVPYSLATLLLYLIGGVLSPARAVTAVALYLSLGLIGLPVFSGFGAGVGVLLGPSGGFLMGYLPCVLLTSLAASFAKERNAVRFFAVRTVGALSGALLLYALGVLWYMHVFDVRLLPALAVTALPFFPAELLKLVFALLLTPRLRRALRGHGG